MSSATAFSLRYGCRREIGYQRTENQDQIARFSSPHGEVFLLADGMGGYEGGLIAANMAITGFERHFLALAPQMPLHAALAEAARLTNADIFARGASGQAGTVMMGSTLAIAVVQEAHFVVGHAGDSRVYLLRDGRLNLLTRDHTAMQRMLDAGLITPEDSRNHPDAGLLTRALGQREDTELEISEPFPLADGDTLMLCSDGLSGYVEGGQIEDQLHQLREDPQRAADALAELALQSGGFDNISVWVVGAHKPPTAPAPSTPPVEPDLRLPVQDAAPSVDREQSRQTGRRRVWMLATLLPILALGAGGWLVWQRNAGVRNYALDAVHSLLSSKEVAPPEKTSAPRGARGGAPAAHPRPPSEPASGRAAADNSQRDTAPPASAGAASNANADRGGAGKIHVIVVYPPLADAAASDFVSAAENKLVSAGFVASRVEKPVRSDLVWRTALPAFGTSLGGMRVAVVFLPGHQSEAARVCQIVGCAGSGAAEVRASDLELFQGNFQGRHIAVFVQFPAGSPPKAGN